MPTQHASLRRAAHDSDHPSTTAVCPYPLTPPPDSEDLLRTEQEQWHNSMVAREGGECVVDDNTAAGMSMMQEIGLYFEHNSNTGVDSTEAEKDKPVHQESMRPTPSVDSDEIDATPPSLIHVNPAESLSINAGDVQRSWLRADHERMAAEANTADTEETLQQGLARDALHESASPRAISNSPMDIDAQSRPRSVSAQKSDEGTRPWCFSKMRLSTHYPSSLMHPGSKFEGTQQSDRQTYSVSVTFLTVNIPQCTLSGYLKIEGLTPDHPTLTTFFRGEIIGGPNQRYSFQTKNRGWGATDKTDLMHWARFSPWRPLSREAKRDLSFDYPIPGSGPNGNDAWWQQDHVFMRWKEEFLVPDHRVRSIQGASFEGFYYICFSQIEGKISGIYFHARSEKYQRLELQHQGEKDIWSRGVRPSMEFR